MKINRNEPGKTQKNRIAIAITIKLDISLLLDESLETF